MKILFETLTDEMDNHIVKTSIDRDNGRGFVTLLEEETWDDGTERDEISELYQQIKYFQEKIFYKTLKGTDSE